MKKILSLILVVITVLSFGACGNKPESGSDTGNGGTGTTSVAQNTPKTVMDMFDGERKVWFLIDSHYIAHDSIVRAVFVTENKQITEGYFISSNYYYEDFFRMSDLDKLSDDVIISSVSKKYKDISKPYTFKSSNGSDENFYASNLPMRIQYDGILDSTGNNLQGEIIELLENENIGAAVTGFAPTSGYSYEKTIIPTTIKSHEYVGINGVCVRGGSNEFSLITKNTFDNFGELELDSIEGASELY